MKDVTAESIFKEYESGRQFKDSVHLFKTVENNENFFIGKQWEGVESNGLPTPVFNFLKRVTLFQVASILSDNIKMQASPLSAAPNKATLEEMSKTVTDEFESIFEYNKVGSLLREFMRNAAVDGDGCLYTYWDADVETGQPVSGAIVTEVISNLNVHFGNPNERRVQRQPYIIIESRETVESVKRKAKANGVSDVDLGLIQSDTNANNAPSRMTDNRVTVLLKLWKDHETGEIWACECVNRLIIRKPWNMGIRLYPVVWLNWDYIQDCYHGQALISGLIPNQVFVNRTFAMVQLSLMQSAFPKTIYDKTRINKWTNQVGAAIGVNGGDVSQVAKVIEGAQISPQVSQFIDATVEYTQTFLGATSAALGDTRPDNTSAIIALQRASSVPSEITKQNLYQCIEDLGKIYIEFMANHYGQRYINAPASPPGTIPMPIGADTGAVIFDFDQLGAVPMLIKLDVGAASYYSEIASMQTLDNLLMNGHITAVQYLKRLPSGYVSDKEALISELEAAAPQVGAGGVLPEQAPEIPMTAGFSALQRSVLQQA